MFLRNGLLTMHHHRRFNSSFDTKQDEDDFVARNKQLEPMKLPGGLNKWTGTVMYPNEETELWDHRKLTMLQ